MGQTEGTWRLKAIIVMFLFIFCMYSVQGLFLGGVRAENDPSLYKADEVESEYENIHQIDQASKIEGQDYFSAPTDTFKVVNDFISFLTFSNVGLPFYAWLPIMLSISICAIVILYIVYTVIYEIVKALPLT